MIAKIKMSTSSGRTLGYDLGDEKYKDQRVVLVQYGGVLISPKDARIINASWKDGDDKTKTMVKGVATRVAGSIARQFDSQASVNSRVKNNTGHLMISHEPTDIERIEQLAKEWKVTPAQARAKIDLEFMAAMGLDKTQYVIIQHRDTHCPHDHIAYNRVQYDGTVVNSKHYKYRCQKIAREISRKYGLTVAEIGEHKGQRKNDDMKTALLGCIKKSRSWDEYKRNASKVGILVSENRRGCTHEICGCSYSRKGEVPIPGSRIDRSLSYRSVTGAIAKSVALFIAPSKGVGGGKDSGIRKHKDSEISDEMYENGITGEKRGIHF